MSKIIREATLVCEYGSNESAGDKLSAMQRSLLEFVAAVVRDWTDSEKEAVCLMTYVSLELLDSVALSLEHMAEQQTLEKQREKRKRNG